MDHSYFRDRVSAYLDHGLPPLEQKAVGEHLGECEECRKLMAELQRVDRLVETYSQLDGDQYWEKSAQKIEKRLGIAETEVTDVSEKRGWGLGWKWATAAASVAVLVIVGLHQSDILRQKVIVPEAPPTEPTLQQLEPMGDTAQSETDSERQAGTSSPAGLIEEEVRLHEVTVDSTPAGSIGISVPARIMTAKKQEKKGKKDTLSYSRQQQSTAKLDATEEGFAGGEPVSRGDAGQDLGEWRHRKDSLMRLLKTSAKARSFEVTSDSDYQLSQSEGSKRRKVTFEEIETRLLKACYRVALLSKDSTEVKRATEIVERIADDSSSANRRLAAEYLDKLRIQ